jgi:hypothetical protein
MKVKEQEYQVILNKTKGDYGKVVSQKDAEILGWKIAEGVTATALVIALIKALFK